VNRVEWSERKDEQKKERSEENERIEERKRRRMKRETKWVEDVAGSGWASGRRMIKMHRFIMMRRCHKNYAVRGVVECTRNLITA